MECGGIMKNIAWAIIRNNGRYLLAQHAFDGECGGTWAFPSNDISGGMSQSGAAQHGLRHELGILAHTPIQNFSQIIIDQYNIHIFLCEEWNGNAYPADKDIIGLGWFTLPEIYALGDSLSSLVSKALPQLWFLVRHHHKYIDYIQNRNISGREEGE